MVSYYFYSCNDNWSVLQKANIIVGIYWLFNKGNSIKRRCFGIISIFIGVSMLLITIVPYSHFVNVIKQPNEGINQLKKLNFQENVNGLEDIVLIFKSTFRLQFYFRERMFLY